jgi:hypothetical protein
MADVEDIKRQRDRIVSELTRMGLRPAASDSNYVFFGGLENPHEVWQELLDAGCADPGRRHSPGHLRVTAGTETETTAFLEALESILAGQPSASGLDLDIHPALDALNHSFVPKDTITMSIHRINRCRGTDCAHGARHQRVFRAGGDQPRRHRSLGHQTRRCRSTTTC